ncbi:MAG TPA: murein L,D-transpeptidase [Spirochaetes bacterium]|nr:murein L,D-transpeptidase [Spirochaetota bacterium]
MERAEARGDNPGCDIALHGLKKGYGWLGRVHRIRDWTYGCIAVSNAEMDQIYYALEEGTLVEIEP